MTFDFTELLIFVFLGIFLAVMVIIIVISTRAQSAHNKAMQEQNERLEDKIDELRLQLGILQGRLSATIHLPSSRDGQEKLPYTGAKRGPKPKNFLNSEE